MIKAKVTHDEGNTQRRHHIGQENLLWLPHKHITKKTRNLPQRTKSRELTRHTLTKELQTNHLNPV